MRISLLAYTAAVLCIGTLALFALTGAGGTTPQEAPEKGIVTIQSPIRGEAAPGIEGVPDKEKSVTSRLPGISIAPEDTTRFIGTPAPDATEGDAVNNEGSSPQAVDGDVPEGAAHTNVSTPTPEESTQDPATPPGASSRTAVTTDDDTKAGGEIPDPAISPEATVQGDNETSAVPALEADPPSPQSGMISATAADQDDDETEATPTLERDAPPRPGATMAKSHKTHHRPLILSNHPVAKPGSSPTAGANQTRVLPAAVETGDGLIISGVGVLLTRTPEDATLTRNGVEIANLDWLLDTAMRLGGRRPRVTHEGETFTITVTVEARNVSIAGDDPACVALVPPPVETGIYEITRTGGPEELRSGERAVWEFSVFTRAGRLTLEDLTLSEERQITNLTSTPDIFSFRAYAFTGDQEHPSMELSDPVISLRPTGEAGMAEDSPLPPIYTLAGIQDSTLRPSETITGAWARGIDHDTIASGAAGHLDVLAGLGREGIADIYLEEDGGRDEIAADATASPFEMIAGFFNGLFGWLWG